MPLVGDGHPRRSVPIKYCRQFAPEDDKSLSSDFAYCVLSEEPNVQPTPILMHCEVEETLTTGKEVIAVGFGLSAIDPDARGVKRFAKATLTGPVSSGQKTITIGGAWNPGKPSFGDSGGPLFVRMDDDSYRVVGLAVTNTPVYVSAWLKIEWMLEDPTSRAI